MSCCSRRILLLGLPALAACGFEPVYGPGASARLLRGKVRVDAPDDQSSYLLVRNLEQRLGRPGVPDYRLSIEPTTTQQGQAVTVAGEITRYSIVGIVDYSLRNFESDTVVTQGRVRNFTGFSATGSTVETLAAESDALERLMEILADEITARLYSTLGSAG